MGYPHKWQIPEISPVFTSAEALLGFELGSDGHGAVVEGGLVGAGHGCHG